MIGRIYKERSNLPGILAILPLGDKMANEMILEELGKEFGRIAMGVLAGGLGFYYGSRYIKKWLNKDEVEQNE